MDTCDSLISLEKDAPKRQRQESGRAGANTPSAKLKEIELASSAPKQRMNLVVVGHVDHGKSTVVGRLLADTNSLPEGKLEQVREKCDAAGKRFEYAFLLDALMDEQRSIMIGIVNDEIVHVPFTKAIKDDKPVNERLLGVLQMLSI